MLDRRSFVASVGSLLSLPQLAAAQPTCGAGSGRYEGPVVAEFLPTGRAIRLREPFTYVDRCGKRWTAPRGAISDGASVPGFLWNIVGSPLVGKYRDAAVVHDWYCSVRTEPYPAVHRMFYEAMIASGVAPGTAARFYLGVRIGGPSWDELTSANAKLAQRLPPRMQTKMFCQTVGKVTRCILAAPSDMRYLARGEDTKVVEASAASEARLQQLVASLPIADTQTVSIEVLDQAVTRYLAE